ncbi:hypothetical protein [Mycolicibacterium sp. XJ870]
MRSPLTAGIALAGAGMIAVSPISPVTSPLSDVVATPHVSSASVELTALTAMLEDPALTDPVTGWLGVFGTAFDNVKQIGNDMSANPMPVLNQVIANQAGYGQLFSTSVQAAADSYIQFFTSDEDYRLKYFVGLASDYLAAGNVTDAAAIVSTILFRLFAFANPLINTMQIPIAMGQNAMNVLAAVPQMLMPLGLGVLNPVQGAVNAFGDSAQSVLDALNDGDSAAAFTSVLNSPAVITGAILSGYTHGTGGMTSGLFTPATSELNRGLVETLLVTVPQTIAKAIGWQGPSAVPAQEAVAAELPVETDETSTSAQILGGPVAGRADASRITESTASALDTVKTVTLSIAPQRAVADAPTTGSSAETGSADAGSGVSTDSTTEADAAADKNTGGEDRNAAKEAKRTAKQKAKAAKREAQAQRRAAKHENRGAETRSNGGKHRAGADQNDKPQTAA